MRKSNSKSKKLPKISPIKITRKSKNKKKSYYSSVIKKVESKKKSYSSPIKKVKSKSKKKSYSSPIKKVKSKSKKKSYSSPIKKVGIKKKSIKKVKRRNIYCGNNLLSPLLIPNGGDCVLGTNYGCLKTGIGRGLHSPIDLEFLNYEPIDPPEKIYCGNKTPLPDEYDKFGRRNSCLQKGVAIGKRIRLEREGLI
jgi:hypothetical protein